jgi:hypothetical protein
MALKEEGASNPQAMPLPGTSGWLPAARDRTPVPGTSLQSVGTLMFMQVATAAITVGMLITLARPKEHGGSSVGLRGWAPNNGMEWDARSARAPHARRSAAEATRGFFVHLN